GARVLEGGLAIDYDESALTLTSLRTRTRSAEPDADGPWGEKTPDHYFPCHGQPVQGTLQLTASPSRLRARCLTDVYVTSGRAAVESSLVLEAEGGIPDTIDLLLAPGPGKAEWSWVVERAPTTSEEGVPRSPTSASSGNRIKRQERLR